MLGVFVSILWTLAWADNNNAQPQVINWPPV